MMNVSFAQRMNLKPGDVIIVPKTIFKVIEHYIVYWKREGDQDYYLENNNEVGVRWMNEAFFTQKNTEYNRIRRFDGDEVQRSLAIQRATELLGYKYDLRDFNCEHYANHVQYGTAFSKQVDNSRQIAGVLAVSLLAVAVIKS